MALTQTAHSGGLVDFLPHGSCPDDARKTPHQAPAQSEVGPGTNQEIIVMGLAKQGTTSISFALKDLGYNVAHNSGDVLGKDGCSNVIVDCCHSVWERLDEKHPEATWVLLYTADFEVFWKSAVKHWRYMCNYARRTSDILDPLFAMARDSGRLVESMGFALPHNAVELRDILHDHFTRYASMPRGQRCPVPDMFDKDPRFKEYLEVAYSAYHGALHCYFQDRLHAEVDIRSGDPWRTLEPLIRNGTRNEAIDMTQPFTRRNSANSTHGRDVWDGIRAGDCAREK